MTSTFDRDAEVFARTLPSCWSDEYRLGAAKAAILANTKYDLDKAAYDAVHGLPSSTMPKDRGNPFLPGSQLVQSRAVGVPPRGQLPPSQQQSSNMLTGRGGMNMAPPPDPMLSGYRNNNNRNGDQQMMPTPPSTPMRSVDQSELSVQDLLDMVQLCLRHFQGDDAQRAEFMQGLADMLDFENNNTNGGMDQLPNVGPLAAGGGNNLARMTQSSNRGTFSRHEQDDDLWQEKAIDRNVRRSPRPTRDQRRRPAQDSVMASARREREQAGFLSRFPEAAHIQFSDYSSNYRRYFGAQ